MWRYKCGRNLLTILRSRKHKKPILKAAGTLFWRCWAAIELKLWHSREKIFEKIALKQRLDVMRKSRSLAVLREELQKQKAFVSSLTVF